MPYYITQISVSLTARNDEEAKQKIEKLLNGARENKEKCKKESISIGSGLCEVFKTAFKVGNVYYV